MLGCKCFSVPLHVEADLGCTRHLICIILSICMILSGNLLIIVINVVMIVVRTTLCHRSRSVNSHLQAALTGRVYTLLPKSYTRISSLEYINIVFRCSLGYHKPRFLQTGEPQKRQSVARLWGLNSRVPQPRQHLGQRRATKVRSHVPGTAEREIWNYPSSCYASLLIVPFEGL